ncbi:hypothetical protein [Psychrobacillus antarcticus]|nr:hypothetical protein [Psychrobacillus antarcticus]
MCIDHDGTIPGLTKLADKIHSSGAKAIVQLYQLSIYIVVRDLFQTVN